MINRKFFYEHLKSATAAAPLYKVLTQRQMEGMEIILKAWEHDGSNTDHRKLAYMLATAYHETARTMQPIAEYGKGEYFTARYWQNKKVAAALGNIQESDASFFRGRGYVQLTGRRNYTLFQEITALKLVSIPQLAGDAPVAAQIMFEGMKKGLFTGKKLDDYFNGPDKCDWVNARRIINGTDKAKDIAGYAIQFLQAISML